MFHRDIDDHRAEEGEMSPRKSKRLKNIEDDEEEKEREEEQVESPRSASPRNSVEGTPIKKLTCLGCPDQHQIPVNCGNKEGILDTDKLAKGEECIECMGCWYTPSAFERFGGRSGTKKWKQSICYQGGPLGVLFENGHLKSPTFKKQRSKNTQNMKTVALDASEHSSRVSGYKDESEEEKDSDSEDDDGDDDENDDDDKEYSPSQDISPLDTEEEVEKEEDEEKEEEIIDKDEEQDDSGGLSPTDQHLTWFIRPGFEEIASRIGVKSRTCLKVQLEQVSVEEGVKQEEESEADMEQATPDSPVKEEEVAAIVVQLLSPQTSPVMGVSSQTSPLNLKPIVIVCCGDAQSDEQTLRLDTSLLECLPLSINSRDTPSTVIINQNLPQMSATTALPTQHSTPSIETDHHNNLTDKETEMHSIEQEECKRREDENKAGTKRSNKSADTHYDDNDDDEEELTGNGQHAAVGNADGMPPALHQQQPRPITSAFPLSTSHLRRQAYCLIPKKTPSLSGYQGRQSRLNARERRRERREALLVNTLRRISSGQHKIIDLLQRLVDRSGPP